MPTENYDNTDTVAEFFNNYVKSNPDTKGEPAQETSAAKEEISAETTNNDTSDQTEEVKVPEERVSKKLALLERKEREIQAKLKEYNRIESQIKEYRETLENVKRNPIKLLEQAGITYEELTNAILNPEDPQKPENKVSAIEKRLEEYENRLKQKEEQEKQAYIENTINTFKNQIVSTIQEKAEDFELINNQKQYGLVYDVIEQYWNNTGKVLDINKAAQLVEEELEIEADKLLQANKLKRKFQSTNAETKTAKTDKKEINVPKKTLSNKNAEEVSSDDDPDTLMRKLIKKHNL